VSVCTLLLFVTYWSMEKYVFFPQSFITFLSRARLMEACLLIHRDTFQRLSVNLWIRTQTLTNICFPNLTGGFLPRLRFFSTLTEVFSTLTEVFTALTEVFPNLTEVFSTLTEVFLNLTEVFIPWEVFLPWLRVLLPWLRFS